jgi:hypothetical protein
MSEKARRILCWGRDPHHDLRLTVCNRDVRRLDRITGGRLQHGAELLNVLGRFRPDKRVIAYDCIWRRVDMGVSTVNRVNSDFGVRGLRCFGLPRRRIGTGARKDPTFSWPAVSVFR